MNVDGKYFLGEEQINKLNRKVADDSTEQGLKQIGTIGEDSEASRVYDIGGIARTQKDGGGMGAKTGLYDVTYQVKSCALRTRDNEEQLETRSDDIANAITTFTTDSLVREYRGLTEQRTDEAKEIRKEAIKNGHDFSPRRGKQLVERTDGIIGCITSNISLELLITNGSLIRRLTPLEGERVQGFEDNWTQTGKDNEEVSDSQRYKCIGNAVTTNVLEYLFGCLKKNYEEVNESTDSV